MSTILSIINLPSFKLGRFILLTILWVTSKGITNPQQELIQASMDYLISQQSADGSWKSQHFGVLKQGQALTPFVLFSLLNAPNFDSQTHQTVINKGLDFIHQNINDEGLLGLSSSHIWEYPNYATAYALRCLVRSKRPKDKELIPRLQQALLKNQYDESEGFSPSDKVYGGWGFGGWRRQKDPGHMDLAHTRVVLQALAELNTILNKPYHRATHFLTGLQNPDGGFYFSPTVFIANKGHNSTDAYGSYSSATCDAILSLLACKNTTTSPLFHPAEQWLSKHTSLVYPEGIPKDHPSNWGEAMFYYHLCIKSEVLSNISPHTNWHEQVLKILKKSQKKDGSFSNPNPLLKESDPLLSTSLALQTMISINKTNHHQLSGK